MSTGDRDHAVRIAIAEVIARSWNMTREYLADNEVVTDAHGAPVVARVDATRTPGSWFVYFPIRNEKYFLVAIVARNDSGELEIAHLDVWAGARAYLGIYSKTVTCDEITARVQRTPTRFTRKGEPRFGKKGGTPSREHVWILEPERELPGEIEEKLGHLLDLVEAGAAGIASLGPACMVQISLVYEAWLGNGCLGGFHLDPVSLRRVAALGAHLDADLYAWGPRLTDAD
jgi:hypothetical protein